MGKVLLCVHDGGHSDPFFATEDIHSWFASQLSAPANKDRPQIVNPDNGGANDGDDASDDGVGQVPAVDPVSPPADSEDNDSEEPQKEDPKGKKPKKEKKPKEEKKHKSKSPKPAKAPKPTKAPKPAKEK